MTDDLDYLNNLIDQGADSNGEVEVEKALLALCMRLKLIVYLVLLGIDLFDPVVKLGIFPV